MAVHYQKKKVAERPTREMDQDELIGLLTEAELAESRRKRATVQPPIAEHSPLPTIEPEPSDAFRIDTRELDVRVFQKHALNLGRTSGAAPVVAIEAIEPAAPVVELAAPDAADEATELVAPIRHRGRIVLWTTAFSVVATALVLLFLVLTK